MEKKLAAEETKYANKLRSYKRYERFGDSAADKINLQQLSMQNIELDN
jgi:hypothetical protein